MTTSTISTINKILTSFEVNPAQMNIVLIQDGIDNAIYTFALKDNSKAVLRLSKRDVANVIDFETQLLEFLSNQHVPVAQILPTNENKLWVEESGTVSIAFEYVEGEIITVDSHNKPSKNHVLTAGRILGKMHKVSPGFTYKNSKRRSIYSEFERALGIKERILRLKSGDIFIKTLERYKSWARVYQGPQGVIHNDYIPSNIIFQNPHSGVIIDFDWACYGPLIKDLGIALCTWTSPDGLDDHWQDLFAAFIDGYNETTQESIPINKDLYKWICFSVLSDACTFFADLSIDNNEITDVKQCRRYMKYLYFEGLS